jgi:hypothetical protein
VVKNGALWGHRRWLPPDHLWRRNKRRFNGAQEMVGPLEVLDGDEIMRQLECVVNWTRTGQKLPNGEVDWTREVYYMICLIGKINYYVITLM